MGRHAVEAMRFPPLPRRRRAQIALRVCLIALAVTGLAATSKVFVNALQRPRDLDNAREALHRSDTLPAERIDAIVLLRRDVAATIAALQSAASGTGPDAEHARNALVWIERSLR